MVNHGKANAESQTVSMLRRGQHGKRKVWTMTINERVFAVVCDGREREFANVTAAKEWLKKVEPNNSKHGFLQFGAVIRCARSVEEALAKNRKAV